MTEVLVVGAGIGGLTLACALKQLAPEVRVEVVERDADVLSRAQGYSVALRRRHGLAVLRRLGFEPAIEAIARPVPELRLLAPSGKPLRSYRSEGPGAERGLLAVPRARLRELLLESLPPGTVSWSARAVGFAQRGRRVEVRLEEGAVRAPDVVVACDGARSTARSQVLGEAARYVGLSRIGALADRFAHPLLGRGPFITLGNGCSVFVHPFAAERLVWSFTSHATEGELGRLPTSELRRRITAAAGGWHEPIATLVQTLDEASLEVRDLYDVRPPTRARVGRIVFLGDASHAMTPYRGTGANMAMDDALELAGTLARARSDGLEAALAAYEEGMLPRNRAAVRRSRAAAQSVNARGSLRGLVRNARLRAADLLARGD